MSLCSYFYLVCTLLPVLQAACPGSSVAPRTLDQDPAPAPWHAILYSMRPDSWEASCGATLVSTNHIVTAARCFWSEGQLEPINTAQFRVAMGKLCKDYDTIEPDMQVMKVKSVTLHPSYHASTCNQQLDIAVVELRADVVITAAVDPAYLEMSVLTGQDLPAGSSGTVAEWVGIDALSLNTVRLPYLDFTTCADLVASQHGLVPSTDKFCAGNTQENRTLCTHDAGAGFMYQHPVTNMTYLRGVFSSDFRPAESTDTCYQYNVAGFTNVADPLTLKWLTSVLPAPSILCPAVATSVSVITVYCYKGDDVLDCSFPMPAGSVAVSSCNRGYVAGSHQLKSATCAEDGTWSNAAVSCLQVNPSGYEFHAGLGSYKIHTTRADWYTANETCADEGGHLAIVNSEAEFELIVNIRNIHHADQLFLGFHDMKTEGEFFTIFGQPLEATGFNRWCPSQPDNYGDYEDCGTIYSECGLNDLPCYSPNAFICEIEL